MPTIRTMIFPWAAAAKALYPPLFARESTSLLRVFLPLIAVLIAVWFITVPIHELLHVAGCLVSGGRVTELTIQPMYGGTLLSKLFGFITPGGDYAGQLTGFDTAGSDRCYFVTVCFPFLLTIFLGFPLLVLAARSGHVLWHGIGIIHTILPIASLMGDYYEMGSIAATRLLGYAPGSETAALFRGDDLVLVLTRVWEAAPAHGTLVVTAGFLLGVVFVVVTLDLSILMSRLVIRNNEKRLDK
ncbi:MAG: hypothetical protein ABIA59_04145 [Candidatus Latescibacterota bacterium]